MATTTDRTRTQEGATWIYDLTHLTRNSRNFAKQSDLIPLGLRDRQIKAKNSTNKDTYAQTRLEI